MVLKNNKMPETSQLCFMEVNLDVLKDLMGTVNNEKEYESLQDQILRRDLSLVVSKEETFEKVITAVEKVHGVIKEIIWGQIKSQFPSISKSKVIEL